jgi:hypothetical protein
MINKRHSYLYWGRFHIMNDGDDMWHTGQ